MSNGVENFQGSLLMVAAMAGFAMEDLFVKSMSQHMPVGEVLMLLGLGGTAIFAAFALKNGDRLFSRDLLAPAVIGRNFGELVGTLAFVCAIAFTPLAQASAILQATPLAVTLGAALFLGEKVGWRRWSAIMVGFAGVLVVIRPGTEGFSILSLFAVVAVVGLAARDVVTRRVPRTITSMQLATYGFATVIPAGAGLMVLQGPFVPPTALDYAQIAGALIFGTAGYYALIAAMRIGEVAVITPFRYTRLIFALIIGWAVFAEKPDLWTLVGGAIIVGSGLYTLARQRIRARANAAPAKA
ncbi:EamA family transporter [Rhodobacter sp. TJ_12]|uniref:DMT family transporter n=1 Tax=Rhodobacter sp. TJ_12 TaxID=2029399 RepID=UPI001CC15696|nr:DMT family transporter [Rhodobacter sp. TJ_12]MBZ4022991.1 EamA family transporter [Rhodobacter sp. TJ_12]